MGKKYDEAKEAYLSLKHNFESLGRYDDASWAYRKERRMEKMETLQKAGETYKEHRWREAASSLGKVVIDQIVQIICDYGEGIKRVLATMVVIYLLFTLGFGVTGSVRRVVDQGSKVIEFSTADPIDWAIFSLGAMTTMDPADLRPANNIVQFFAGIEALFGIFLTGLLGFVVGNRIRRS